MRLGRNVGKIDNLSEEQLYSLSKLLLVGLDANIVRANLDFYATYVFPQKDQFVHVEIEKLKSESLVKLFDGQRSACEDNIKLLEKMVIDDFAILAGQMIRLVHSILEHFQGLLSLFAEGPDQAECLSSFRHLIIDDLRVPMRGILDWAKHFTRASQESIFKSCAHLTIGVNESNFRRACLDIGCLLSPDSPNRAAFLPSYEYKNPLSPSRSLIEPYQLKGYGGLASIRDLGTDRNSNLGVELCIQQLAWWAMEAHMYVRQQLGLVDTWRVSAIKEKIIAMTNNVQGLLDVIDAKEGLLRSFLLAQLINPVYKLAFEIEGFWLYIKSNGLSAEDKVPIYLHVPNLDFTPLRTFKNTNQPTPSGEDVQSPDQHLDATSAVASY